MKMNWIDGKMHKHIRWIGPFCSFMRYRFQNWRLAYDNVYVHQWSSARLLPMQRITLLNYLFVYSSVSSIVFTHPHHQSEKKTNATTRFNSNITPYECCRNFFPNDRLLEQTKNKNKNLKYFPNNKIIYFIFLLFLSLSLCFFSSAFRICLRLHWQFHWRRACYNGNAPLFSGIVCCRRRHRCHHHCLHMFTAFVLLPLPSLHLRSHVAVAIS